MGTGCLFATLDDEKPVDYPNKNFEASVEFVDVYFVLGDDDQLQKVHLNSQVYHFRNNYHKIWVSWFGKGVKRLGKLFPVKGGCRG